LKNKSYEERLSIHNLTTLEIRRVRGDSIEVFEICKGFDSTDSSLFFKFCTAPTRGLTLEIFKLRSHLDIRKFSLAYRVIDAWNSLDDNTIARISIIGFKNRIDKFVKGRGFIKALLRSFLPFYLTILNYTLIHEALQYQHF
jgi:ribonucleases P/MRP protein subunit RPP40